MNVWVFNAPNEDAVDFIFSSLKIGISRFGWSYIETADLEKLTKADWPKLSEDEKKCLSTGRFLLEIKPGDWIVHVNVPKWGHCTAVQVSGGYSFDQKKNEMGKDYTETGDYRHQIQIDPNTIISFDRNDPNVLPYISRRLKLQGPHWKIYDTGSFEGSLDNLKNKRVQKSDSGLHGLYHLKKDLKSSMRKITEMIQKNHPGKSLEDFLCFIFKKVPHVVEVKNNGSGFGTDYGADIIVTYSTGLPILNIQENQNMVIQVKSFEGSHSDLTAVEQIITAVNKFDANIGLIITTGDCTTELEKAVEKANLELLEKKENKRIFLMTGGEVASFVLKFGAQELLDV